MPVICDVRVCQPVAATSPSDWRTSLGQILIEIETTDKLTGYGVGGGGVAGMHVIQSVLRNLLIGREVEPIEEHWACLKQAVLPFGPEGIAMMAISGLDLALWDLRGKRQQQPIACILNPQVDLKQPVPTYQTVWDSLPEQVVISPGGVKLHLGLNSNGQQSQAARVDGFVAKVSEAREAIGPDRPLMVDAWMTWDVATTLEFAQRVESYDLCWIEEPLPLTEVSGYKTLRQECSIPIAGGEHVFSAENFRRVIEEALHSILQPDVCWVGGLSELIKIYEMAQRAGLQVVPHRGAELWGLHAVAALSAQPLAESGRPWMDWVLGQPEIDNGQILIPDRPGWGVEIEPAVWKLDSTIRI